MKRIWKTMFAVMLMSLSVCLLAGTAVSAETVSGEIAEGFAWSYDTETKTLTLKGEGDIPEGAISSPSPWEDYKNDIQYIYLDGITSPASVRNQYNFDSIQTFSGRYGADITWKLDIVNETFEVNGTGEANYDPWSDLSFASFPIQNATIGDSLTKVNWIEGCYIENLTIGASCLSYQYSAVNITVSPNNPYFSTYDGSVYTKGFEKLLRCDTKENPKLHPDVKTIAANAFTYNTGTIIIPWGVTTIEEEAFQIYGATTQIVLPDTLTSVKNLFNGNKDNHVTFICSKSNGVVQRDIGNEEDSFDIPVLKVVDSLAEYYPGQATQPEPSAPAESDPSSEPSAPTSSGSSDAKPVDNPSGGASSSQPSSSKPAESSSKPAQTASKPASSASSVSESSAAEPSSQPAESHEPSEETSSEAESSAEISSVPKSDAAEISEESAEDSLPAEAGANEEADSGILWIVLICAAVAAAAVAAVILVRVLRKKE